MISLPWAPIYLGPVLHTIGPSNPWAPTYLGAGAAHSRSF